MTDRELESVLAEVAQWLRHPEAGDYRLIKLHLLLDKGHVDLAEAIRIREEKLPNDNCLRLEGS